MRSARSRLSRVPAAHPAAAVSASVSGAASTAKRAPPACGSTATTVRQTPLQAIEAPMAIPAGS
jgi:hypothetical protein